MEETYTGIPLELTPEQENALYRHAELVGSASAVKLEETDPSKWRMWKRRNQDGSSSCVYQARAKAGGILREQETGEFVEYSASDYVDRTNPGPGSNPVEAFDFWRIKGMGLESLEPSQNLSESEMHKVKQDKFDTAVAELSKIDNYVALPTMNFDTMVSTLKATGKPIPFGFYASRNEWNSKAEMMVIKDNIGLGQAYARHEVCATPNFGIWNGKEGFTFEDSSIPGIDGTGVLFMTREFFEKRNYLVPLYPTKFKTYEDIGIPTPAKPKIHLTRELERGDEGVDVFQLQQVLKYEGFFPANHPGSEIFWTITEDAVKQYQKKYGIVSEGTPDTTGFGRVGPKTMADINTRYA